MTGLPSSVVEHPPCKRKVVSSILTGGSTLSGKDVLVNNEVFDPSIFGDLIAANSEYVDSFKYSELTGSAARGLAIVTCMDSRINPLSVVGMRSGDAKILRNAGARVTEDVLRTLVLATYLLNVDRILVMPHTDCRMAQSEESSIHELIDSKYGVDTRSLEFRVTKDQETALKTDITRVRAYPLIRKGVSVAGAIYDVKTGKIDFKNF